VKIRHRLLSATKRDRVYYYGVRQREQLSSKMAFHMMVDPHNLGLPCLCLLWKAAPGLVWSLSGAAHNQLLPLRRDNPALMAVRISLMSLLADYPAKPRQSRRLDRQQQPDRPARLDYPAPR
jgi:hypothetical protein